MHFSASIFGAANVDNAIHVIQQVIMKEFLDVDICKCV